MEIRFTCDCGNHIDTVVSVPEPNFAAERSRDSVSEEWEEIFCGSCLKEHEAHITSTFSGADCSINNGDLDVNFGVAYYPMDEEEELDWLVESDDQLSIFQSQVKSVGQILDSSIEDTARFDLLVMLHGHVVAAVESYLSSTFIHLVTNSNELIRKLVETDPVFSKQKFTLKEMFEEHERLQRTVATYLNNLIFHDLKKVKPMYKDVIDFDFGNIGWLFNAVSIRHHCVHRAGYDKEGNTVNITSDSIKELVSKSTELIESIEEKVTEVRGGNGFAF